MYFCILDVPLKLGNYTHEFQSERHGVGVRVWGQHSTMVSILASEPSCPMFDSQRSQNFVAEVNQRHC